MVLTSVGYSFTQKFSVPAEDAFVWSIDYDPADWSLMGLEGKRKISRLSKDAIILEDTRRIEGDLVTKTRLIRINPKRLSFTNTHISGPTLHSQFWYEFFPEGKEGSRLEFTGLLLIPSGRELTPKEVSGIASREKKGDSRIWVNLAKAMESDYAKAKKGGRPSRTPARS